MRSNARLVWPLSVPRPHPSRQLIGTKLLRTPLRSRASADFGPERDLASRCERHKRGIDVPERRRGERFLERAFGASCPHTPWVPNGCPFRCGALYYKRVLLQARSTGLGYWASLGGVGAPRRRESEGPSSGVARSKHPPSAGGNQ